MGAGARVGGILCHGPRILGDVPLPTITIVATVTFIVLSAIMAGLLAKEERAANSDLVTSLKRIGLGRRWVDQVILVEVATTMLAALICGVISSVVAVWLTGRILSGALTCLGPRGGSSVRWPPGCSVDPCWGPPSIAVTTST